MQTVQFLAVCWKSFFFFERRGRRLSSIFGCIFVHLADPSQLIQLLYQRHPLLEPLSAAKLLLYTKRNIFLKFSKVIDRSSLRKPHCLQGRSNFLLSGSRMCLGCRYLPACLPAPCEPELHERCSTQTSQGRVIWEFPATAKITSEAYWRFSFSPSATWMAILCCSFLAHSLGSFM